MSIVDYLNEIPYDSSFASRRLLWEQYRPGADYSGTAEQNIELLDALKLDEVTPKLELVATSFATGSPVKAILKGGPALIETDLGLMSLNAASGEEVSLGAAAAGFYTVRARNGLFGRSSFMILSSAELDGQVLNVKLIPQPVKWEAAPPAIVFDMPVDPTLPWMKYVNYLKAHPEIFQQALDDVFNSVWFAGNVVSLSATTVVCALGIWNQCIALGASNFIGAAADVLKAAADRVPDDVLPFDEKNDVKTLITNITAVAQFGLALGTSLNDGKACTAAAVGISGTESFLGTLEQTNSQDQAYLLTARVFVSSVGKLATLMCLKKLP